MDFETQRKKRMEALEDKRRRLEEMRKNRKDRTETSDDAQVQLFMYLYESIYVCIYVYISV
jgi:hypothetical protein